MIKNIKMENENNTTKRNPWIIVSFCLFLILLGIGLYITGVQTVNNIFDVGYTKATIDEANYTSQTGVIYYLMNISNYTSRNSTTISQIQYEAIASCVKSKVCTWNQTKYDELNRKQ